jgi:U3 small nucleolar RNA-associated protein 12
LLLLKPLGNA